MFTIFIRIIYIVYLIHKRNRLYIRLTVNNLTPTTQITQLVLEWQVYPHIRRSLHILVEIYLGLKCVFHFSFVDLLLFHAWSTRLPLDFLRWCPICLCVITQAGSNFLRVTKPYTQTLDNRTESFFCGTTTCVHISIPPLLTDPPPAPRCRYKT